MTLVSAALALAGLSAIFAALGLGGAIVYGPVLATWYPLPTVAIPLALFLNVLTSGRALAAYGPRGWVDWRGLWPLAAVTALAALAGSRGTHLLPPAVVATGLGTLLLAVAAFTLWRACHPPAGGGLARAPAERRRLVSGTIGLGVGVLSGLFGIGGGVFIGPLLVALGYEARRVAGATAFVSCAVSTAGFAGHVPMLAAPWPLMAATTGAVLAGSTAGTLWLRRTRRPHWVPFGYALLLAGLSVTLLVGP